MILLVLETLLVILAGLSLAWLILIHLLTWSYFRWGARPPQASATTPPASIIRPVFMANDAALGELRSFSEQDYPGDYEVLFCAERTDASSIRVITGVIDGSPHVDMRLLLSDETEPRAIGKLRNTITGVAHARHDVVVFADDDVSAPRSYLQETLPWLMDRRIGLAFSAPAYQGCESWAAALMGIFTNALVLRIATASVLGGFDGAVGTTMISRKSVLERIGGLQQLGRQIVDDVPLGRAIVRHGYRVRLLRAPARVIHRHDTFVRCWSHIHRWLVIIRHYFPVRSAMLNVLDCGLWWALLSCGVAALRTGGLGLGVYLVGGLALASVVSAAVVNLKFAHDRNLWRFVWVAPVLELVRLPLIVHSLLTNEIHWRGRRFRVHRDCTTTQLEEGQRTGAPGVATGSRVAGR